MTTLTVENYLKAILQHELQTGEILMSTGKIAEAMIVSPGTVTIDLDEDRLLVHCLTTNSAAGLRSGEAERRTAKLEIS